jgi:hypothetical protein
MSAFLRLGNRDLINGLVVAVIAAIGSSIVQGAEDGTFNIFTYDWLATGKFALSVAFAYIVKNLLSDGGGKFLGKIG